MIAFYSIGSLVLSVINYIISAFVSGGTFLLVNIYNLYISKYLLSPGETYPSITAGTIGKGVQSLYYFTLFQIYDPIFTIVLAVFGIIILLSSSFSTGPRFKHLWIKILLIMIISNISFFLAEDIIYIGFLIYSTLWHFGAPLHNFSQGNNILRGIQLGGSAGTDVSFLILIIFIFLILFLLLFLSMRLAIIYTFPILLPFLTLLYLLPQTRELSKRAWDIFIDSVVAPILMSFPLILSTYVVHNSVLTLGFLALTDSIPILLAKSPVSRTADMFLGQSVSIGTQRTIGIVTGLTGSLKTAASVIASTALDTGEIRGSRNNSTGSARQYSTGNSANFSQSQFFRGKP